MPDFRNLGVLLRTLVLVNLCTIAAVLIESEGLADAPVRFLESGLRVQPLLLVSIGLLALASPVLCRFPVQLARGSAIAGVMLLSVIFEGGWRALGLSRVSEMGEVFRVAILAGGMCWVVLRYFDLRHKAIRPSLDAAQLAALTARIRPHFLFNSLNAVLSLIRKEPQRAEAALECLADMFRVLMRDPRDLVLLSDEIALCRQYLELERLRLRDRLNVEWAIDDVPSDALVPPLMLQPLIENAVYHGIETTDDGGMLRIRFVRQSAGVLISIENTHDPKKPHGRGNQLALDNIRQRLALHYDLEASMEVEALPETYRVTLVIPIAGRYR